MGAFFSLKHTNVVAYLISPESSSIPRFQVSLVQQFLNGLQSDPERVLLGPRHWIEKVAKIASGVYREIVSVPESPDGLLNPEFTKLLDPLRREFCRFSFYVLPIGGERNARELHEFGKSAATPSGEGGLILIPDEFSSTISVLDPFPGVTKALSNLWAWPGVVFWLANGSSTFVQLAQAPDFLRDLVWDLEWSGQSRLNPTRRFAEQDARIAEGAQVQRQILHLSDLHFGAKEPRRLQRFLLTHLAKHSFQKSNSIVITGDLFDNPKEEDANDYENFRSALSSGSKKNIYMILGNHDQKVKGNSFWRFGKKLDFSAQLEWSNVAVDHAAEMVFVSFDSSRDADFARGRVSNEQLADVATKLDETYRNGDHIESYLKVALVHHHPFSFETTAETRVQKVLNFFGSSDERFLRMDDADQFVEWCARRNIELILHGHKHVQRYVNKMVSWENRGNTNYRTIISVGCGASLGVGNAPLSYNVINWDRSSRRWSATFFESPANGAGFEEQLITLHSL